MATSIRSEMTERRPSNDDVIFLGSVVDGHFIEPQCDATTTCSDVQGPISDSQHQDATPDIIVLGTPDYKKQRARCVSVPETPGKEGIVATYVRPSETVKYPHPRSACLEHPFSVGDVARTGLPGHHEENSKYCDQCYCYICDIPAKECRLWNGRVRPPHCEAHSKCGRWRILRQLTKLRNDNAAK